MVKPCQEAVEEDSTMSAYQANPANKETQESLPPDPTKVPPSASRTKLDTNNRMKGSAPLLNKGCDHGGMESSIKRSEKDPATISTSN